MNLNGINFDTHINGKMTTIYGIDSVCDMLKNTYTYISNINDNLIEENKKLKSKHYKSKEIASLTKEI